MGILLSLLRWTLKALVACRALKHLFLLKLCIRNEQKCDEGGLHVPRCNMASLGRQTAQFCLFAFLRRFQHCLYSGIRKEENAGKGEIVSPDPETGVKKSPISLAKLL